MCLLQFKRNDLNDQYVIVQYWKIIKQYVLVRLVALGVSMCIGWKRLEDLSKFTQRISKTFSLPILRLFRFLCSFFVNNLLKWIMDCYKSSKCFDSPYLRLCYFDKTC